MSYNFLFVCRLLKQEFVPILIDSFVYYYTGIHYVASNICSFIKLNIHYVVYSSTALSIDIDNV